MALKALSMALVGAALIATPALAQKSTSTSQSQASQKQENASSMNLWQGSKLIGLNVYNGKNEKIGDIKQLMVDKSGNIKEVAIGVGGFLGIGERDVAVKFSDLKFSNTPVRNTSSSANGGRATTGTNTASSSSSSSMSSSSNPTYPDHAVWDVDKSQVQSMPQFNYSK